MKRIHLTYIYRHFVAGRSLSAFRLALLFILPVTAGICLLPSCQEETFVAGQATLGEEVSASLYFGHRDFEAVTFTTRATLGEVAESRVSNLYVGIFANGKRVYSHYFDKSEKKASQDLLPAGVNAWCVQNRTSETDKTDRTQGCVRMQVPTVENARIYIIANIDADMVNISPEKLNTVRNETEMQQLTATMNQEITSRNGYFPMTAQLNDVTISDNKNGTCTISANRKKVDASNPVQLERLDAKVIVNVVVDTAAKEEWNDTTGEGGEEVHHTQYMKDFHPTSWRVINLPKGAYAFPQTADYDESGYFNSEAISFEGTSKIPATSSERPEITELDVHSFSFYMLENREKGKQPVRELTDFEKEKRITKVHLRELRRKNADGTYNLDGNGLWEYAPEAGSYLEIKGEVVMEVSESNSAKTQELCAEVIYYIHLGDFGTAPDNYDICRNTRYTYTITVKGAYKVELEVHTSQPDNKMTFREDQPGAEGLVYIAKESVETLDAHYEQRVFSIDQASLDPESMTWYVKTPFGREGSPRRIVVGNTVTEIPAGLDYKWVHFMLNPLNEDGTYSKRNQPYPGDGNSKLMDVIEFTEYMRTQKRLYDSGQANDFRAEEDPLWKEAFPDNPAVWQRHRVYFTVFVDEFYYEYNPITGEQRTDLWKSFVNQPNRLMHLLCDSEYSLDGASTTTSSVITLRQRSIQTPYNLTNANLSTGWGTETVDEERGNMYFYNKEKTTENSFIEGSKDFRNDSQTNGLYNTACLLELITNGSFVAGKEWTDFLDYSKDYTVTLQSGKQGLLYATLLRNRDNNGNGKIDVEELRWYIASTEQLYGLYIGGLGLNEDATLYPRSMINDGKIQDGPFKGYNAWRNHVVSSTKRTGMKPDMIWAEEGLSISNYLQEWESPGCVSTRCVRNLGIPDATTANIVKAEANVPEVLIKCTSKGSGASAVYRFDQTNVNDKSLRFYTTHELEPGDEFSEMSRPYYAFETGERVQFAATENPPYVDLKKMLERGESPCPDGYRVPNVREAGLMYLFCRGNGAWWTKVNQVHTCTSSYYSLGFYGNGLASSAYSWNIGENVNVSAGNVAPYVRCVRDVKP